MSRNPLINALAALAYIVLVALVMFYGEHRMGPPSFLMPVTIISLFTLSAAMMGYIFLYQPVQLYLDGKKKVAVNLFIQTLAFFAAITFALFILLFSRIIS